LKQGEMKMAIGVATKPVPDNLLYPNPTQIPVADYLTDGAITIVAGGLARLTHATGGTYTLADPTRAGLVLTIVSTTAQAHTVTVASGIDGAGAGADVGTWGGAVLDGVTLISTPDLYWTVSPGTNLNVTFA
jgi:hypothetical protein